MSLLFFLLSRACAVYLLVLFARVILDWVQVFNRDWRPQGLILLLANSIYLATDPPVKALRGMIPPVRLGAFALDVAFLVVVFAVLILERILLTLSTIFA